MSKLKYAVLLNADYTAELHYKEHGVKTVVEFPLNKDYPITHIKNRDIVNAMLNSEKLITGEFDIKTFPSKAQMIIGTATKLPNKYLFDLDSESGFSLIELAVSCAIMVALSAMALSYYIPAQQKMLQQIEDVKAMQAANPDIEYLVTFN